MRRSMRFALREIAGEALLIPLPSKSNTFNGLIILNATGRLIWELLERETSLDSLASAVAKQFDIDLNTARADVDVFIGELRAMGLV